ncbi:hypothetical protein DSECCO2_637720 [anaerobic digester metagenome]
MVVLTFWSTSMSADVGPSTMVLDLWLLLGVTSVWSTALRRAVLVKVPVLAVFRYTFMKAMESFGM